MKAFSTDTADYTTRSECAWPKKLLYVVGIGVLVAINIAMAKYAVSHGVEPINVTVFPMVGAAVLLMVILASQRQWKYSEFRHFRHFRYYVIAGVLGVSLPNLASSLALQSLNTSTFSVLVTLSPIFTLLFAIPFERHSLTRFKVFGIIMGVVSALLVTITPFLQDQVDGHSVMIALLVPLLLGAGNVYRSRALPRNANPIALAAGMLSVQGLLWLPAANLSILFEPNTAKWVLGVMSINTALSYLLTFRFQRVTDGVGLSQVGNVVTITGVCFGVVLYGESLTIELCTAALLLGVSLYLFNKS